jgi:glycerate kinase
MSKNIKQIFLLIGGSATNDAGIGMAAALGFKVLNFNGKELIPIGSNLL